MTTALAAELHLHLLTAYVIFLASYLVFAVGKFPGTKIDRPAAAVIGAAFMFAFRIITPAQGLGSIDFETLVLLFSMMLLVSALHLAGFFEWIINLVVHHVPPSWFLPVVIFTSGILSAFLINDVVCLFMAPLVLQVAKRIAKPPAPYLLALATASNIGSTATITGNPQNILIGSISHIAYRTFLAHLGPVALMGLFLDWLILHWIYRKSLGTPAKPIAPIEFSAPKFSHLAFPLTVTLLVFAGFLAGLPPALTAVMGGAIILVRRSMHPELIYKEVDWSLLTFFTGLFLVVGGAEAAGIAQQMISAAEHLNLHNMWIFSAVVVFLSNIVSNVPAVMLLKNLAPQAPNPHQFWLLLAMTSTLAGNLTVTGSVANIITIEKTRNEVTISFTDYLRAGVPITVATLLVGLVWLWLIR